MDSLSLYDSNARTFDLADSKPRVAIMNNSNSESRANSQGDEPAARLASGKGIHLEVHRIEGDPSDDNGDMPTAKDIGEINADKSPHGSGRLSPLSG